MPKQNQIIVDIKGRPDYPLSCMGTIKSVIFDWGGVLIDDPAPGLMQYCADALGVSKQDYIKANGKFQTDFQKGLVPEDTFWSKLCGELNVPTPRVPFLWALAFEAVYRPKPDMFALARSLGENGFKIALLSNTEAAAVQFFYKQKHDIFDVPVFSCAEGTRKPEREIYELTLTKLACKPGQAVFIDDRLDYINGAIQVGLKTILFKSAEQTKNELSRLGVKTD